MKYDIKLPPLFEVNQNKNGNTIQKLLVPETSVNGTIANQ